MNETKVKKYSLKLIELLDNINNNELNNDLYLHSICNNYKISKVTNVFFRFMNTKLMIEQIIQINKMINYIFS